jgi:uncharacterized damage-inducible protein DinB
MDVAALLLELYDRLPPLVREAVEGLDPDQLIEAPRPGANTIGWLVWHLTRVEDEHIAHVAGCEQLWATQDWPARFGLPADPADIGYGHTPEQVAAVRPSTAQLLVDYHDAVHEQARGFLKGMSSSELDRVVDTNWDPPVTLGVRLVSIADDALQHLGQAAYLRGLLTRS